MGEKRLRKKKEHSNLMKSTRRDFIKNMAIGGGAVIFFGNFGLLQLSCKMVDCHFPLKRKSRRKT